MKQSHEWKASKINSNGEKFFVNPLGVSPSSLYITLEAFRVVNTYQSYLKGHLVDLGCGNVPYYEWYKEKVDQITCIDWKDTNHSQKYIDIFCDLNESLPLPDNCVDCVFTTSVLEHICEPKILFKEMARILAENRNLILTVPFFYHLHEEPYDFFRYTPHGLKYLGEQSGLSIIESNHYGSALGVLVDITAKVCYSALTATTSVVGKYTSNRIASFPKKIGDMLLILFQQVMFWLLKQKLILLLLTKLRLSPRIALGYTVVFTKKSK